jgi:hypothetical protein
LYADIFCFGKESQGFPSAFSSYTTILHATERSTQIPHQPTVHPADPALNIGCQAVRYGDILCPDASR